jgi:hypothetical protein
MSKLRALLIGLGTAVMWTLTYDPAAAIDLTGTWRGELRCTQQRQGESTEVVRRESRMAISQLGTTLAIEVDGLPAFGQAVDDGVDVTTGIMAFSVCGATGGALGGDGTVDIGENSAKITGHTNLFTNAGRVVQICTMKLKRTSRTDPGVDPCNTGR